jgi:uncharacterized protein YehS (DUF1456 family)
VINNDVLRRIRYIFDLNDTQIMAIFSLAGTEVTRAQMSDWLKKEDDPAYQECDDAHMQHFLDGLITDRRGKKEGATPKLEKRLTNNTILRKLKIALDMKDDEVLEMMALASLRISKHELSALFRRKGHKHYRECKDQILRNFLAGLQMHYRPEDKPDTGFKWKPVAAK